MEKYNRYLQLIENETNYFHKIALINNLYYHIFTSNLQEQIGRQQVAKMMKEHSKETDVYFWKSLLVKIQYITSNINYMHKTITEIEDSDEDKWIKMWKIFALLTSHPQLFICYPHKYNRSKIINKMKNLRASIFKHTHYDIDDLLEIMIPPSFDNSNWRNAREIPIMELSIEDLWKEYTDNKTVETFLELFDSHESSIDDEKFVILLKKEIEGFLIFNAHTDSGTKYEKWTQNFGVYGNRLIFLHKKLCDLYHSEAPVPNWTNVKQFEKVFSDMDNMYKVWKSSDDTVEFIYNKIEAYPNLPILEVFYEYTVYPHPCQH